jgi:myosin heavy subunit
VVAELEERRDQKVPTRVARRQPWRSDLADRAVFLGLQLGQLISGFQAVAQGYIARKRYRRAHGREDAIRVIQRNATAFIDLYQWPWWKLYRQVRRGSLACRAVVQDNSRMCGRDARLPQIAPLSKQFNRDEEERKLRSDLAELTRKYEKEHEAYLVLESKVTRYAGAVYDLRLIT